MRAAEFRGPGVRHQFDRESPDEYELDLDSRGSGIGGKNGRVILLGDGTEVLTDSDDADMFDHNEEDMDTKNQISKGTGDAAGGSNDEESIRGEREGTPAPPSVSVTRTESPSSTQTEDSDPSPTRLRQASDASRKPEETT